MFQCPHCGERTISFWRKQRLIPLTWMSCDSCGKDVKVAGWAYYIANLPLLVSIFLMVYLENYVVFLPGFIISLLIHWKFVPLKPKYSHSLNDISAEGG